MLLPGFADAVARTGFAHRASEQPDGTIVYRLADGSRHVRVQRAEWERLRAQFERQSKAARRRAWILLLCWPFAPILVGLTLARIVPAGAFLIFLVAIGMPIAIYVLHFAKVRRIGEEIERQLARAQPCAPVPRDLRRAPRWLDLALLLVIGPNLLIGIAGSIGGPDFFRETPLWGRHIGAFEVCALAIIALRIAWPLVARLSMIRSR